MKISIRNARLAFPVLFKPEQFQGTGEPNYSAQFLLVEGCEAKVAGDPKAKWGPAKDVIEAAITEVAEGKWKDKAKTIIKNGFAKEDMCLHDGDMKADYEGFAGNHYLSTRAKAAQRPLIINRDKTPLNETDGLPYSGCYVNANVELWAQDNNFGKKVNAQVRGVQFVKDGDSFGGGSSASTDEFDEVEVEDGDKDEMFE